MTSAEIRPDSASLPELFSSSRLIIRELLTPGGIENWMQRGRLPWLEMATYKRYSLFRLYVPPEKATPTSTLEKIQDRVICYVDERDTVGQICSRYFITSDEGDALLQRYVQEYQRQKQVLQSSSRSLGQRFLTRFSPFSTR